MIIKVKTGLKKQNNIILRLYAKLRNFKRKPLYYKTPIIINNFNRLTYLKELIEWLEKANMKNIFIVDNNSTYPPLLEFYKKSKYIIFRLNRNIGHEALWKTHLNLLFCKNYYIYTDPDVLPIEECPDNFILYFYEILDKYKEIDKVGFSIKTDDIPDFYEHKKKVLEWEKQFWEKEIEKNIYIADIDTTFALYRPNVRFQAWKTTLRTGYPYMIRHQPWYIDKNNLSKEEMYYQATASNSSSWIISQNRYD